MTRSDHGHHRRLLARVAPGLLLGAMLLAFAQSAAAHDQPANNMSLVHEKLKADKKRLVSTYMTLSDAEAAALWPVYEAYQKDLKTIHLRIANLLETYAADIRGKSLSDDGARKLIAESVAIEQADVGLRSSYAQTLGVVLPAKKVARYLQIENKIRVLAKYDLAAGVPLVQ